MLSIGSTNSFLSMFSTSCNGKYLTDCSREPSSTRVVRLRFPDLSWQNMLACNYTGYRADPRADECDYQAVTVNITTTTGEFRVECKGRRKGGSTWQDVDAKPSFKIKCADKIDLGNRNCSGIEQCPGGGTSNHWQSKKFILNNGGEVGS
jgi:hypothetical protein